MHKHKRPVLKLIKMVFHNCRLAFIVFQDDKGNTYVIRRASNSKLARKRYVKKKEKIQCQC